MLKAWDALRSNLLLFLLLLFFLHLLSLQEKVFFSILNVVIKATLPRHAPIFTLLGPISANDRQFVLFRLQSQVLLLVLCVVLQVVAIEDKLRVQTMLSLETAKHPNELAPQVRLFSLISFFSGGVKFQHQKIH